MPRWRGDIGAFIVGALDDDDRVRLTGHLAVCAGCRAEYDDLASIKCWLTRLAYRRE